MSKLFRRIVFASLFAFSVVVLTYLHGHAVAQEKEKDKAPEKVAAVTKWEYRVVVMGNDVEKATKELNKLGDEGFEIAFVTASPEQGAKVQGGRVYGNSDPLIYYTLKRAKR